MRYIEGIYIAHNENNIQIMSLKIQSISPPGIHCHRTFLLYFTYSKNNLGTILQAVFQIYKDLQICLFCKIHYDTRSKVEDGDATIQNLKKAQPSRIQTIELGYATPPVLRDGPFNDQLSVTMAKNIKASTFLALLCKTPN